jgi:hypothetical protein
MGAPSPHFSRAFYCGGGSGHVYCVALGRAPRRTVEYVCGALGRAPCIHARLRRLATKPREKRGLVRKLCKPVAICIDNKLKPVRNFELGIYRSQMMMYRNVADEQRLCDLFVLETLPDQLNHFTFSL